MRRWRRKLSGAMCIVDFNDGTGGHGCRLVNFSNGGARLSGFVHASAVPDSLCSLSGTDKSSSATAGSYGEGPAMWAFSSRILRPIKLGQIAWQLNRRNAPRLGALITCGVSEPLKAIAITYVKAEPVGHANTERMDMSDEYRARAAAHIENAHATADPALRDMFLKLADHFTWLAARPPLGEKSDPVRELMRRALAAASSGSTR
jgi:hypothetical protein